jgi:hypothetical protein
MSQTDKMGWLHDRQTLVYCPSCGDIFIWEHGNSYTRAPNRRFCSFDCLEDGETSTQEKLKAAQQAIRDFMMTARLEPILSRYDAKGYVTPYGAY